MAHANYMRVSHVSCVLNTTMTSGETQQWQQLRNCTEDSLHMRWLMCVCVCASTNKNNSSNQTKNSRLSVSLSFAPSIGTISVWHTHGTRHVQMCVCGEHSISGWRTESHACVCVCLCVSVRINIMSIACLTTASMCNIIENYP